MNYLIVFLLSLPANAPVWDGAAWGGDGHRLVCEIAWQHLTTGAKSMVSALRAGESGTFSESCTWADEVRNDRPQTYNYHFINIPPRQRSMDMSRDCGDPAKRCAPWAIKHYALILADTARSRLERSEALKFMSHFVGDLHQPLHAGRPQDLGGNRIHVSFFGDAGSADRPMQLHSVWDSGILRRGRVRWPQSAAALIAGITTADVAAWTSSDVIAWTNESYRLDEEFVYSAAPGSNIDESYFQRAVPIARQRLQQAGIRLAFLLNEAARGRTSFTF